MSECDHYHHSYKAVVASITVVCSLYSEGDPMGGWSTGTEWRADVRYAAMVVKVYISGL